MGLCAMKMGTEVKENKPGVLGRMVGLISVAFWTRVLMMFFQLMLEESAIISYKPGHFLGFIIPSEFYQATHMAVLLLGIYFGIRTALGMQRPNFFEYVAIISLALFAVVHFLF